MKKLFVALFIFLLTACSYPMPEPFTTLPKAEFADHLDSGRFTVIDVRTPEEIASGVIEEVDFQLDYKADTFEQELRALPKDEPYLLYCGGGVRSCAAMEQMEELGFQQVNDLEGGWKTWIENKSNTVQK